MKKKIGIVGSTGSIGTQALDVINLHRDKFEIVFLSCNSNVDLMVEQGKQFSAKYIVSAGKKFDAEYFGIKVLYGYESVIKLIENEDIDLVLIATTGFSGVLPTYVAAKRGVEIALANKESIVAAGSLITEAVKRTRSTLIPVDSEHSAVFQCLMGQNRDKIEKVILTASGGPFRNRPFDSFDHISKTEALKHPNWSMGAKITIDSATMMNKGLELIEAKYLFDLHPSKLDVVIHPQSIIHSMVSFVDGSFLAQLGYPDMRTPISFSLMYPERLVSGVKPIDFKTLSVLTFQEVDFRKYRCLELAINVLNQGNNSLMIAMNAANEVAVEYFLKDNLSFQQIYDVIEGTVEKYSSKNITDIDEIFELDILSRETAKQVVKKLKRG
ncbi:MAG: 1-deoxy-D-xylulose-5-phosphate reductoisomerase [Calditerrivibrio sp.]|nr:1-deoxy-D-xylulose-5-phosphate reductoisomerase [Calditerrivibrio sp.]MCA1980953.1 1-deoxy-D-xylulose-5-phosphate reductoisomerase [Calditerrivibrio sp.]